MNSPPPRSSWSIAENFICVPPELVRGDVEPETWRAFELTVIENRSIDAAAVELDKPVGTIYAARSRIMRRLRKAVQDWSKSNHELNLPTNVCDPERARIVL